MLYSPAEEESQGSKAAWRMAKADSFWLLQGCRPPLQVQPFGPERADASRSERAMGSATLLPPSPASLGDQKPQGGTKHMSLLLVPEDDSESTRTRHGDVPSRAGMHLSLPVPPGW